MNANQIADALLNGLLATYEPAGAHQKAAEFCEELSTMGDCLETSATADGDAAQLEQANFLRTVARMIEAQVMGAADSN